MSGTELKTALNDNEVSADKIKKLILDKRLY